MKYLILIILLSLTYQQICTDYSRDQEACILSQKQPCKWNSITNQCLYSNDISLGCNPDLNLLACINQLAYPNRQLAECIFSGYCRSVEEAFPSCSQILSRAACLGVKSSRCKWQETCLTLSDEETQTLVQSSSLTSDLQNSSIAICQGVEQFPCVHQKGVHEILIVLYFGSKLSQNEAQKILNQEYEVKLNIPGCLIPSGKMYDEMTCDTAGLNWKACVLIPNYSCIFINEQCEQVKDFNILSCSDKVSKQACLSITNFAAPCKWENNECLIVSITASTACDNEMISPSVCANNVKEECFYNEQTKKCSPMCRSANNVGNMLVCKQSQDECKWEGTCQFDAPSQCGYPGQNKLACMAANEKCTFLNGACKSITSLILLKCEGGLNKLACTQLTNPSQVCQFNTACMDLRVTPEMRCGDLLNVNPNACRKITSQWCYYDQVNGNCQVASGNEECLTSGLNRLGCLLTSNSACRWDTASGTCLELVVSRTDECSTLKLVNAVACRSVTYRSNNADQLCSYNASAYACNVLTMTPLIQCDSPGLNQKACSSISNGSLSCRWLSGQCVSVTSLGQAISCSSLSYSTYKTCALVSQVNEKCVYDSKRLGCSTSVKPDLSCSTSGLNSYACAFQGESCYFNNTSMTCSSTTNTILANLNCSLNFPSKSACLAITKTGQYCKWSNVDSLCSNYVFPTTTDCDKLINANQNLCLAYEVSVQNWVENQHYCTYDGGLQSCALFTGTITDCGSSEHINLHACVAKSSAAKSCYFDTTSLKCTELMDQSLLSTLQCKTGNQSVCVKITTIGQRCRWYQDLYQSKCYNLTTVSGACNSFSNVNSNICAMVPGAGCQWNSGSSSCQDTVGTNQNCSTLGLNESACIGSTVEPCYYDQKNSLCVKVDTNNADKLRCNDRVNQQGCLTLLGEACQWLSNSCKNIDNKDFNTVTCTSLVDNLYNPIVCGSVTTSGEKCAYDSMSNHCTSVTVVTDCKAGYNQFICATNDSCEFKNLVCVEKPSPPGSDCDNKPEMDCLTFKNAACMYSNNKCLSVKVYATDTCSSFSNSSAKYNPATCQSVTKPGEACQYDSTNYRCQTVSSTTLPCNTSGLNWESCSLHTLSSYCYFDTDPKSNSPGCNNLPDITKVGCISFLNKSACVNVSKSQGICIFNIAQKTCAEQESYEIVELTCAQAQNSASFVFTPNYCTYLIGTSCQYDTTNLVCMASTTYPTCTSNASLNSTACLQNVTNETCTFSAYTCTVMSTSALTLLTCSQAQSFKQCTHAGNGICQWNGTACVTASVNVSCITLSSINSRACMSNVNGTEKCQFYDSGLTTSCIIPVNDTQPCAGLNKVACLANTANPCYYYEQCIDISLSPDDGACDTGYYLTEGACMRIQKAGQTCQWNGTACIKISVSSTDSCTTYSAATNSPAICASIVTSSCYWNMGCQSGNGTNCNTLGANSLACKGATSGNCIFTNYRCLDVQTNDVKTSQCTDPSNQNGCLQLNNGEPCQWSGSTCSKVSVSGGCTSYTSVNPGVCAQTSDTACQWNSNACVAVSSTTLSCAEKGLNKLGCLTKTSGSKCRYSESVCVTIDSITISNLECSDNLNEDGCKNHMKQCCQWNGSSCVNGNIDSSMRCSDLSSYSKYCCSLISGESCGYSANLCYSLSVQSSKCYETMNKVGCMWINSICLWQDQQCSPTNSSNFGCVSSLNMGSCLRQNDFCMYKDSCINGSLLKCVDLEYNNKKEQCNQVSDIGCMSSNNGCSISNYNSDCKSQQINIIGCLNNINSCYWNSDILKCDEIPPDPSNTKYFTCPSTQISRGRCALYQKCLLDIISYKCISYTITDTTKCDTLNAINMNNSSECKNIQFDPCIYDNINQKCTSTISTTDCLSIINNYGCRYVTANCIWNQYCINSTITNYYSCESIFTKYICLSNILSSCKWDSINHLCNTYTGITQKCDQFTDPITSPGVCYYYSTDFCSHNGVTCQLQSSVTLCNDALSPLGCQAASTDCYWEPNLAKCFQLIDSTLAANMTCPQLKYSNRSFCLKPIREGQTCQWDGSLCISANPNNVYCTTDLALNACIAVVREGEQCIFNSKCENVDINTATCDNHLNIYACLSLISDSQNCKWLGQTCSSLTVDGYAKEDHILINQNVCRKTYTIGGVPQIDLQNIGVKYDPINYICISSDPLSDLCTTPGLNYYGCLLTQIDACDWTGIKCTAFIDNIVETTCNQYQSVSPKVCADRKTLNCKFNSLTYNCEDSTPTDTCATVGLSLKACLNIVTEACIWKYDKCQKNPIMPGVAQCSLQQQVNARSCALIEMNEETCKYAGEGICTTNVDPNIERCDTAGMNRMACILVSGVRCVYSDGQCQYSDDSETVCNRLDNVNAAACNHLQTEPCKFSKIYRGCTIVHSIDQCDSTGINLVGCNSLSNCTYLEGINQCMCQGLAQLNDYRQCSTLNQMMCINDCIWDNLSCRNKLCEDLSLTECISTNQINSYYCYVAGSSCHGAKQCSEIFNTSDCTLHTINGQKCGEDLLNLNHCVDFGCQHYEEKGCGGQCQWSSSSCVKKECYLLSQQNCVGTYQGKACYWDSIVCRGISTCMELSSYLPSDTANTVCPLYQINGRDCQWSSGQCTSSICRTLGNSRAKCEGVEDSSEVCVLLPDFNCVACEEIKDDCICMKLNNYCSYSKNNGCQSRQCSDFSKLDCVSNSSRCEYISGLCKQNCQKLNETQCKQRAELNECHWDSSCKSGPIETVTINTLSTVIEIVNNNVILQVIWMIMIIIQI